CLSGFSLAVPLVRRSWPLIPRWTTRMSPPSSLTSRYLPRRSMPVILRPSSLAAKCFLLGWRRIDRMPLTSTCLMRRPTTSFSRSRRTVSTSGSSGIGAHLRVLRLSRRAVARRGQRSPGFLGRSLLGLLLGPTLARTALLVADVDGGVEALGVVGALFADVIARHGVEALGGELLEAGLVVLAARPGCRFGDALAEQREDELVGRIPAPVEVDGADHGLHGVGEDRRLLPPARRVLALAEGQGRPDAEIAGQVGQHAGVDHRCPNLGQLAFGQAGEGAKEVIGHDQAEHGVAQELEALVGLGAG